MDLLRSFRFSTYVTLGIACLCLDYAEGGLLPETPYITTAVVILLGIGYRLEGRWSLTLNSANLVGAFLTLLLVGWVAFQIVRKPTPVLSQIPFPTNLLPYLGPVLMILIPAKLFRPKHVGDYWAMQGIGLLAVALGCAMANDVYFGILLIVYICSFIWSLSLFYLYREVRPGQETATIAAVNPGRRFYMLRTTWRWSAAIASSGLLLFLATPRPQNRSWELPMRMHGKMEMGLSEGGLDLNRTGSVDSNKDIVFQVFAEELDRKPKLDLSLTQYWRSRVLSNYQNGKWSGKPSVNLTVVERVAPQKLHLPENYPDDRFAQMAAALPDLGAQRFFLSYKLNGNSGGSFVLASPVFWRPVDSLPIHVFGAVRATPMQQMDGEFGWTNNSQPRISAKNDRLIYSQVYVATKEPDLGPQLMIHNLQDGLTQLPSNMDRDRLRAWTDNVLISLVEKGKLSVAAVTEIQGFTIVPWIDNVLSLLGKQGMLSDEPVRRHHDIASRHHEAIARALADYFSHHSDFAYTLNLERHDQGIDPVEDFLYNVKSGHCQRFASALVLVLRNLGIPSQIVMGFRGCESRNDGWYDVKQYHAHVWVEVLVKRSPPTVVIPRRLELPKGSKNVTQESHHWLSLDPTPESDAIVEHETATNWLQSTLARGESFFKFILLYDSSARDGALNSIIAAIEETPDALEEGRITWLIGIVGCVILVFPTILVIRGIRRRRRYRIEKLPVLADETVFPIYKRLLGLLAKHQWIPHGGETAQEFASRVTLNLGRCTEHADAGVLAEVVEAYYRVRFGGQVLTDRELVNLDEGIQRFEDRLTLA